MKTTRIFYIIGIIVLLGIAAYFLIFAQHTDNYEFDGERAYQDLINQMNFGPRIPGSVAHQKAVEYFCDELSKSGWNVNIQNLTTNDHEIQNIIAKRGNSGEWIIIGAHYDSRRYADQEEDPILQLEPVPGANDGASGAAILLELSRVIPKDVNKQIWLVFFDAEDQGKIKDWDWLLGSLSFANSLDKKPDKVIIIDMVGDSDLNIYREVSSDQNLTDEVWNTAEKLGYQDYFINEQKYNIIDDHFPFLQLGVPAIDIIDFDYPYWHTTKDIEDKVSSQSLEIVGKTLLLWLRQ